MARLLHRWRLGRHSPAAGQVLVAAMLVALALVASRAPVPQAAAGRDLIEFVLTTDYDLGPLLTYLADGGAAGISEDRVDVPVGEVLPVSSAGSEAVSGANPPGMMVPVAGDRVLSWFGWRIGTDGGQEYHPGLDLAAPAGDSVRAAAAGIVLSVRHDPAGYGNYVVIDHGGEWQTLYAHNERVLVVEGEAVRQGQVLATVGQTGNATTPHLHLEVRLAGNPLDPAPYLGLVNTPVR